MTLTKIKRTAFVGAVNAGEAVAALAPVLRRHSCAAIGCMMAGAFADHSGSLSWWCVYHAGARPMDFARVTSVLNQHHTLRDAIVRLRQLSADEALEPDVVNREFASVRQNLDVNGYRITPKVETWRGWQYSVEIEMGRLVLEAMRRAPV
jgi:hypothetical protein